MFELTLGQGQKVTIQGQICTMVKKVKIVKKNPQMDRCWYCLHISLVLIKRLSWPIVKVKRLKVKFIFSLILKCALCYKSLRDGWMLTILTYITGTGKMF